MVAADVFKHADRDEGVAGWAMGAVVVLDAHSAVQAFPWAVARINNLVMRDVERTSRRVPGHMAQRPSRTSFDDRLSGLGDLRKHGPF